SVPRGAHMHLADSIRSILAKKSREIWALPPTASVYEAIEMMSDRGVGALLVLTGDALHGIISERDYARKVILQGRSSRDTLIREIMTSPVVTVGPDAHVNECMQIMTENRIRHLPVTEHGRVVGILSIGDLVKAVMSAQQATIEQLHSYIAEAGAHA